MEFIREECLCNEFAAEAIKRIISPKYPGLRAVPLYCCFEIPKRRWLISKSCGIVQGGNCSPLEIDEEEGNLSIPLIRKSTKEPVPRGFYHPADLLKFLTTYQPQGETGKLIVQCLRSHILTLGDQGFGGGIPFEKFVFYEDNPVLKVACKEVADEINVYSWKNYNMLVPCMVGDSKSHHALKKVENKK